MAVTESERHQLFESAKAVFGESSAEIFMNLHPNVDWENLATKDDLARFELATKADIARLEIATKADIARLEIATKAEIAGLEVRLQNRFVTVLLASQGVVLAAMTLVFTLAGR